MVKNHRPRYWSVKNGALQVRKVRFPLLPFLPPPVPSEKKENGHGESLLSFVSFVVVVKGLQVVMASNFHDGGSLDISFFQLVDQSLSSAVVCQFLAAGFERRSGYDSLHHFIDTIDAHWLCFIPNLVFHVVVNRKVKGPVVFICCGRRDKYSLKSDTGQRFPPVANIFGEKSRDFFDNPPPLVLVSPSANSTYSCPSSSLRSAKSSTFILWCSWWPRKPKYCTVVTDFCTLVTDFCTLVTPACD